MSEEILKALMKLFALIVKQDGGANDNEIEFVKKFLYKQINSEDVGEYFTLFLKNVKLRKDKDDSSEDNRHKELVSVKDSVKVLGNAKKISKTLDQKQKVVVLIRLFELVNSDKQFTEQRMMIIDTVAQVFKIRRREYKDIEDFIKESEPENINSKSIVAIGHEKPEDLKCNFLETDDLDGNVFVLKVKKVDLYFLKYTGNQDVYLNGLPVGNSIHIFSHGSSIKLPKGKPFYYTDVVDSFNFADEQEPISYNANDLEFRFKSGDIGIRDINISEKDGRLVGILGASGAGKTTLFNVLSGIEKPTKGSVIINGKNLHDEPEELEGIIGYIPQDDLLIEDLTVYQNLYFNAKLCFKDKSKEELSEIVENVLRNLGLYEIAHLKVGSVMNKTISGGQRKRLNIALELIREPSILFVDEPTSGLSSQDSENVMNLLRELTIKGKLVFVVIHQPASDIFKMFDNVIVMDTGGHMIYYGNPIESVVYFKQRDSQVDSDLGECQLCGNINPELIFNIVEAKVVDDYGNYTDRRKRSPVVWNNLYKEFNSGERIEDTDNELRKTTAPPNWFRQVKTFFTRDLLSKLSNKQYIALNIFEAPLLGFILAFLIKFITDPESDKYIFRENENIPQYIFMNIIVALFLGMILSAEEIFKDRKILKRERFLNLSWSGYLISKIFILVTISAIQAFLFVIVGNTILEIRGMLFEYWLTFFTTAVFANLLGLNISSAFNSAVTIYIIIPLLLIPQMILGGAMFSFDKLNRKIGGVGKVPVLAEFITSKWMYEGLLVHQFKHNDFEKEFFEVDKNESSANFKQVYLLPEIAENLNQAIINYNAGDTAKLKDNLALIRNELVKEKETNDRIMPFNKISGINVKDFNNEIAIELENYMEVLKNYYKGVFNEAYNKKQRMIEYLQGKNPELFNKKKNQYHNEAVSEIVRKVYEKNKVLEYNNSLIQNYEPIFLDADNRGFIGIRSHFLSPNKYFLGKYYDTFTFNILIVWFMSLILYLLLLFNGIKNTVLFFENFNLKKIVKRKKK